MDAGNWITIAAASVAAAVAAWQAYEARKARKASRDQADRALDALAESKKQSAAAEKSATSAMLALGTAERAADAAEVQVHLARRAVVAAEAQAFEARRANEIALLKDSDQDERGQPASADVEPTAQMEAEAAAQAAQARQVRGSLANMGGLSLKVTNYGVETVFDLELESIEAIGFPDLLWRANPRTIPSRTTWDTLEPHKSRTFYVEFTDEEGIAHRAPSREYRFTISYTTASGRWRRTGNAEPVRVEQGDTESTRVAASEASRRFQLLRELANRIAGNHQINIAALPEQLGVDDDLVQEDLRRLYEDRHIIALPGDDRIVSVHEITAMGRDALERSGY